MSKKANDVEIEEVRNQILDYVDKRFMENDESTTNQFIDVNDRINKLEDEIEDLQIKKSLGFMDWLFISLGVSSLVGLATAAINSFTEIKLNKLRLNDDTDNVE